MKVGAIVVLYKPELPIAQALIDRVSEQVDVVCVVDNSPHPAGLDLAKTNLNYHHFEQNIGIASAHNAGLRDLQLAGCDFGLLLDQDSQINHDFVFRLSSLLMASKIQKHPVAAIGPRIICSFSEAHVRPRVQKEVAIYEDMVCVTQIISSGMLIDLDYLPKIGLKEDSLFIDGVDHEWCWRARQHDLQVAIANDVSMYHRLGDARKKFVGVSYKVGSPIRLYYQFRNILLLMRRGYVPKYWKFRNLCVMPIRFLANSMLEANRMDRLVFMLRGFWDGILGKQGSYRENWPKSTKKPAR